MLKAIGHGFRNLANFQGRDARQAFWFWVLFLYVVTTAVSMVVTMPMTAGAMATGIQQGIAQAGNADRAAAEAAAQAAIVDSIAGYMPLMTAITIATGVIYLVGLAAAFVRRLHDSDLPGWWALLPGGLQAVNIAMVPSQMGRMQETLTASMSGNPLASINAMAGSFGISALAAWGAIIVLVVLGVRKSSPGPNRYGDAPFVA